MRLFGLIGWQHIRKHTLRYVLLVVGVALGVAVAVAMQGGVRSVLQQFRETVSHLAGASQLQVSAGEAGVPDSLVEHLQSLPEVSAASPVIRALAELADKDGSQILLIAVDVTGDGQMRPWLFQPGSESFEVDPVTFLAQPDSILVSRPYADRRGWGIGSKLRLRTMSGLREFTVRGLLDGGGLDRIYGGNMIVMDVYGAQQVLGRGAKVDWIDIALADGVSLEQGRKAVQDAVGPGYSVAPPSVQGDQLENLLETYKSLQAMAGLFAIALGVCMIDVSFRLAVAQRRAEIGVLRSLGATRRQVQNMFLIEGGLTGALGSLLGLAIGVSIEQIVANTISLVFRGAYGGLIEHPQVSPLPVETVVLAFTLGLGVSLVSCWLPSREAGREQPVAMFRPVHYQQTLRPWRPWALAGGLVLGSASYIGAREASSGTVANIALFLLFLAVVLMIPSVVLVTIRPLRPLAARLFRLEGALALDGVIRAPRRTVSTVAVLMLAFAQAVLVAGVTRSSRRAISDWVDNVFQADLLVSSSGNLSAQWFRFPETLGDELALVPGVASVQALRSVRVPFRGRPLLIYAADAPPASETRGMQVLQGDWMDISRRTAAGEAVYVAESLANLEDLGPGAVVEIQAPRGMLKLPVAGVVNDLSDKRGALFLSRSLYRRLWDDHTVDKFRIQIAPGHPVEAVRAALRARIGDRYPATIFTFEEFRDYVQHPKARKITSDQIQFAVCLVVVALALANMALIAVAERRREIAIMRSIGAFQRQVQKTLLFEILATGGVSLLLGLATGALMLLYLLGAIHRQVAGVRLEYAFPWPSVPWLGGIALACGVIALLLALPALGRTPLSTALDSE